MKLKLPTGFTWWIEDRYRERPLWIVRLQGRYGNWRCQRTGRHVWPENGWRFKVNGEQPAHRFCSRCGNASQSATWRNIGEVNERGHRMVKPEIVSIDSVQEF